MAQRSVRMTIATVLQLNEVRSQKLFLKRGFKPPLKNVSRLY